MDLSTFSPYYNIASYICNKSFAIAVYVGCICVLVISVRVLRLLHNNSVDLQLILYNLLIPIYCYSNYWLRGCLHDWLCSLQILYTLYGVGFLNMHLEQVSLVGGSWSLVGACDLWLGLLLQCIRQSSGSIFWDRSVSWAIWFFPILNLKLD